MVPFELPEKRLLKSKISPGYNGPDRASKCCRPLILGSPPLRRLAVVPKCTTGFYSRAKQNWAFVVGRAETSLDYRHPLLSLRPGRSARLNASLVRPYGLPLAGAGSPTAPGQGLTAPGSAGRDPARPSDGSGTARRLRRRHRLFRGSVVAVRPNFIGHIRYVYSLYMMCITGCVCLVSLRSPGVFLINEKICLTGCPDLS